MGFYEDAAEANEEHEKERYAPVSDLIVTVDYLKNDKNKQSGMKFSAFKWTVDEVLDQCLPRLMFDEKYNVTEDEEKAAQKGDQDPVEVGESLSSYQDHRHANGTNMVTDAVCVLISIMLGRQVDRRSVFSDEEASELLRRAGKEQDLFAGMQVRLITSNKIHHQTKKPMKFTRFELKPVD